MKTTAQRVGAAILPLKGIHASLSFAFLINAYRSGVH
jgi:hypothetical protein